MGNNPNTAPKLEYTALIWPKKKPQWEKLVTNVEQFLMTFAHTESPQETLKELNIGVYQICKQLLPKRNPHQQIANRYRKREELIAKIYAKKYSPRPQCSDKNLANLFKELNSGRKRVKFNKPPLVNPNWKDFDESGFTYTDFKKILEIKRNDRSNFDGLCYELVRRSDLLTQKLLHLYNEILKTGELPDTWLHGIAYGVYKGVGVATVAKHFRPLVRMDTFSKLYWHLIVQRLTTHVVKHDILNRNIQKAYQVGTRGVEESLFIHQVVKPNSKLVVYLDIKNAFGSLQPSFVNIVLKAYGVPPYIANSIVYFLENRTVWIGQESRSWDSGVPQGSVLSNFLFILCMNYILDDINDKYSNKFGVQVHHCKFLLQAFADDIVIFGQSSQCVQMILDELFERLSQANLDLQAKKCLVDYIDKESAKVYLNRTRIPDVTSKPSFKYLGQYAWVQHIWKQFALELKLSLEKIKESFEKDLPNPVAKDYWYAYHTIWKYRIAWFMRVHDSTPENAKIINQVEKDWFASIIGLENRLTEADFVKRQENSLIIRHTALDQSLDSRVVAAYRGHMGARYEQVRTLQANNPSVNNKSGFRKSFYIN